MNMSLSPQQVQLLKSEGYSDQEIQEAVGEVQRERNLRQQQNTMRGMNVDPRTGTSTSAFSYNPNENMIKWQLELNEILERTEHILREDILEIKNSHTLWKPNTDMKKRVLTDYGVQEIMRILSMYLNRNTILGNYTADEVNDKVFDFGKELNDLFFMKYEMIFSIEKFSSVKKRLYKEKKESELNKEELRRVERIIENESLEKRKNYPMIVRILVDVVHSAYSRAIAGGERSSLREARSFTQQEQITPFGTNINVGSNSQNPYQKRSIFNPARYLAGKYK